jgi:hypothetical protein
MFAGGFSARRDAQDILNGGDGNDRIISASRPAGRDIVNCGDGFDRAFADRDDVLNNCEKVQRP